MLSGSDFSPFASPSFHLFVLLPLHTEARKQENEELYERGKKNKDRNNNVQQKASLVQYNICFLGNGEALFVA